MVPVIKSPPSFNLKNIGRHMPRDRYQHGWIEETGKKVKKWKGHYYVYILTVDGKEKRRHCSVILGLKSEMRKWEAERELGKIIERESRGHGQAKPDPNLTFEWFWTNRFLPLKESKWRRSTHEAVTYVMDYHVLPRFGETRLCDLTRFELQAHLNELAKKYSKSVVQRARTWLKAAIEEAIDQDFLVKNPARKLEMPVTRKTCKRYLSSEEVQKLLMSLEGRDRLIARMLIVCALRPGELFALRGEVCNKEDSKLKKLGLRRQKEARHSLRFRDLYKGNSNSGERNVVTQATTRSCFLRVEEARLNLTVITCVEC